MEIIAFIIACLAVIIGTLSAFIVDRKIGQIVFLFAVVLAGVCVYIMYNVASAIAWNQ
jgi:hypothetical protein